MPQITPLRPRLMREVLGESLRARRIVQGRTLRDVSHGARISLGYLSEIERGQKEASSELLAAIVGALDIPLSSVLADVVERMAAHDQATDWATLAQVAA